MKLFYTYIHKKASDNSVFYVGKGVGKRAWDCKRRNPKWRSIAAKHGHTVEVCAEWKTQEEAFEHEKFLIFCFKDMGLNLANLTDGGDGPTGYKYTEEQKQKRKHLRIGYKHSEETKKKIGDAQRGIPRGQMSEEVRGQMSISRTGRKGKPMSEEQKKKLSENNGSRRPEVREKISKSLMGKSPNKEARLKQSMKTKGVKKSEEHKEKIRQGRLAYFQRQRELTGRACTISEEHKAALRKGYNKHFGIEE
jgi:hypothetical protein